MRELIVLSTDIVNKQSTFGTSNGKYVFSFCFNCLILTQCCSCCGVTVGNEQQHNQDLKEICKVRRILEFITFYHNALHLLRVHCATNNSNKNTGKFGGPERVHRSLPRLRVFFVTNFLQHGYRSYQIKTRRSLSDE